MNPKKEFIKAIMSVLRLEDNIYITASVEEITDRIDIPDYKMFIAYLGERKSDYEKPIQSIAMAVEEFHRKRITPIAHGLLESWNNDFEKKRECMIGYNYQKIRGKEEVEKIIEYQNGVNEDENYDVWNKYHSYRIEFIYKLNDMSLEELKELEGNVPQKYDVIGIVDFMKKYDIRWDHDVCLSSFLGKLHKPSIIEKIEEESNTNAEDKTKIESSRIKSLIYSRMLSENMRQKA